MFPSEHEHLALILQALPEFVIVLDTDGYVRYLNRLEPESGIEDAVGRHAHEFTPPDSRALFDHHLAEIIRTGEMQEYDAEGVFPNGFRAWYRNRMLPLDMEGGGQAILMISSNVTALRALEAEVESLRSLLPICSWCGQIQDAEREWRTIERYLHDTAGTQVSHGICPSCHERQLRGLGDPDGSPGPRVLKVQEVREVEVRGVHRSLPETLPDTRSRNCPPARRARRALNFLVRTSPEISHDHEPPTLPRCRRRPGGGRRPSCRLRSTGELRILTPEPCPPPP